MLEQFDKSLFQFENGKRRIAPVELTGTGQFQLVGTAFHHGKSQQNLLAPGKIHFFR